MPEILCIDSLNWILRIWTKDVSVSRERLGRTLARGKEAGSPIQRLRCPQATRIVLRLGDVEEESLAWPPPGDLEPGKVFCAPATVSIPAIFFENKNYQFEWEFKDGCGKARASHIRQDIEKEFHAQGARLIGNVRFQNDAGWFKIHVVYTCGGREVRDELAFDVLATKLDSRSDIQALAVSVEAAYPLWLFSLAKRTDQEFVRTRKPHERFLLLWLAQFTSLQEELAKAVKLIMDQPHARLRGEVLSLRPDFLKGRLSPWLEESIREDCNAGNLDNKSYSVERKVLCTDTPENRFVKMALSRCVSGLLAVERSLKRDGTSGVAEGVPSILGNKFWELLHGWRHGIECMLRHPLWRQVGAFDGLSQESLVLQKRAGYSKVYRIWQELRNYLELFGSDAGLSVKTLDELYQVWCLLQVRVAILALGFEEVGDPSRPRWQEISLERQLKEGLGIAWKFLHPGRGIKVRLSHEPVFGRKGIRDQVYGGRILSPSVRQKPDIVVLAELEDGSPLTLILDAKYRLDSPEANPDQDLPPDEALNQIHRYRDAILHQAGEVPNAMSRESIGGAILFPGWYPDSSEYKKGEFWKTLGSIGIGAIPLLPGMDSGSTLLHEWLESMLLKQSLLQRARIPDKGRSYARKDLAILVRIPEDAPLEQQEALRIGSAVGFQLIEEGASINGAAGEVNYFVPLILDPSDGFLKIHGLYLAEFIGHPSGHESFCRAIKLSAYRPLPKIVTWPDPGRYLIFPIGIRQWEAVRDGLQASAVQQLQSIFTAFGGDT